MSQTPKVLARPQRKVIQNNRERGAQQKCRCPFSSDAQSRSSTGTFQSETIRVQVKRSLQGSGSKATGPTTTIDKQLDN